MIVWAHLHKKASRVRSNESDKRATTEQDPAVWFGAYFCGQHGTLARRRKTLTCGQARVDDVDEVDMPIVYGSAFASRWQRM
jgi:hypothetical protein